MQRFPIIGCLLSSMLAPAVWPQASNSTVRGVVRDQAAAIIPSATVTLTNTATNVARTSQTNESGLYVFPSVIPGPYRLVAEFAGMQKFEGTLTLQSQQDATVDIVLQIAQAVTSVDIKDVTPMVQVDSPSMSKTVDRQRIEQLPSLGRGHQNLLQTIPGVVWSTHGHGVGGRMLTYGLQVGSSQLMVDGAPSSEAFGGWDFARLPDLDAIQELHVEINNSSAKYSRPATLVMSSRSGTNTYHGSLFYTNRNSAYGAARRREDFFEKAPYLNRNEYGLTIGGPVTIPKLYEGKNRTFWFFSWEGTKYLSNTTTRKVVPTEAMRNGDFRGLVDAQGRQIRIYDPFTTNPQTWARQQFAYQGVPNTIDPARISPLAKYLFGITKLPTLPGVNPLIDTNFVGISQRPLHQDTRSIRIDHRFSDSDLVYGRFGYNQHDEELLSDNAPFEPINGVNVTNRNIRYWPNKTLSVTWVHTFSPTLTNELLVTGSRDYHRRGAGDHQTDYAGLLGLPNPFGAKNWTVINNLGFGPGDEGQGGVNYSFFGDAPFFEISNYLTVQENATKVHGKHEFQFGFQFRFEDLAKSIVSTAGSFSAGTLGTSLYDPNSTPVNPIAAPQTGNGLVNFYLGTMNYSAQFRRPWAFMRRFEYAPYFQDTWKIHPRLTLNLGFRYEVRTPLYDRNDLMMSFDYDKRAYIAGASIEHFLDRQATTPAILNAFGNFGGKVITHEEAGLPKNMVNINWKNFGPRLGFAYRALEGRGAFVVRGGYRISYYPQPVGNWFDVMTSPTLFSAQFQNTVSSTPLSPDGLPNYGLRSVPAYVAGLNTPSSIIDTNDLRLLTRGSFNATRLDPGLRDPRVQDWNLTIEKEIMMNMVVRAAYVGNHSDYIQQTESVNPTTPDYIWYVTQGRPLPTGEFASVATRAYDQQVYGTLNTFRSTGFAWYNGIQLELERRYANGVGFQIFYDMANVLNGTGTVNPLNQYLRGAVPTDYEERNRFLNYARSTTTSSGGSGVGAPKHRVRWNYIAELPFGRGKKFGGNASGWLDNVIGGWQLAGTGSVNSNYFTLPTAYYPNGNPIEIYHEKYPIEDCRSGVCFPGFLYWNGYIRPDQINSRDAQGRPNGVMGVPENYKPAGSYLVPYGSRTLPPNAPANTNVASFWDTNSVWIPLNNGTVQRLNFNDNLHPWRNQAIPANRQWFADVSLIKSFRLTERVIFRFNVDFFNVFNNPNNPTSIDSSGILDTRNSGSPARLTQLSARIQW